MWGARIAGSKPSVYPSFDKIDNLIFYFSVHNIDFKMCFLVHIQSILNVCLLRIHAGGWDITPSATKHDT